MLITHHFNVQALICCLGLAVAGSGCDQGGSTSLHTQSPDDSLVKSDGFDVDCEQFQDMAVCQAQGDCAVEPGFCLAYCEVGDPGCCDPDRCVTILPICDPVPCDLQCEHGFRQGIDGCQICECAVLPPCDTLAQVTCEAREDCEFTPGFCYAYCQPSDPGCCDPGQCQARVSLPAPQCAVKGPLGALCGTVCERGYLIVDEQVTCTCCEPPACQPLVCALDCEEGYQEDDNGCEICACALRTPASGACVKNSEEPCAADADCVTGGCGGELCHNPEFGGGITTCECTAPNGMSCGCVAGSCTWWM